MYPASFHIVFCKRLAKHGNTGDFRRVTCRHISPNMTRTDSHTEYIVTQSDYQTTLASLPPVGTDGQTAQASPVSAFQYRQNVDDTINAGKWRMWGIAPETFDFTWRNGAWQPPANLVVRRE